VIRDSEFFVEFWLFSWRLPSQTACINGQKWSLVLGALHVFFY